MKNLRKDASLGVILLAAWLVIRIFFNGSGFFLWVLVAAGAVLTIVGILPEPLHQKVMDLKRKLFKSAK